MTFKLEPYQDKLIQDIGVATLHRHKILVQAPTRCGKTVIFATITKRYIEKTKKDVIIFVDSEKILDQTRRTLHNWYGIHSDIIDANSSHIQSNSLFGSCRVFLAMVETFDRRSERATFIDQVKNVGLVIIDECHMGNFYKIMDHFMFSLILGFTATPIASDKKKPLNKYYDTIVCGPTIEELIQWNRIHPHRGVVEDATYVVSKNISRKDIEQKELELGYKGDDFNQDLVGKELSGNRQVQNTIEAIIKHAPGKKLIVFNANVAHSKLVTAEMQKAGLNAKHFDGTCSKDERAMIYSWFKHTDNAILCNVGMTIKGFDEPSCEGVVLNTLTKSLSKFIQMHRSGTPYQYPDGRFKMYHIVIDMCDNVQGGGFGRWSQQRDWKYIFDNPKLPKPGVAPVKECPECGYMCYASARKCPGTVWDEFFNEERKCSYEFPINEKVGEDTQYKELELISNGIDVNAIVNFPAFRGKKDYFTWYETIRCVAFQARQEITHDLLNELEYEGIWQIAKQKTVEWQRIKGEQINGRKIRNTEWFSNEGRKILKQRLEEYGFTIEEHEYEDKKLGV